VVGGQVSLRRHPEVLDALFARRASKDDGPGRSSFEARRTLCHLIGKTAKRAERLRMTVSGLVRWSE
jgi:hypothetical protein